MAAISGSHSNNENGMGIHCWEETGLKCVIRDLIIKHQAVFWLQIWDDGEGYWVFRIIGMSVSHSLHFWCMNLTTPQRDKNKNISQPSVRLTNKSHKKKVTKKVTRGNEVIDKGVVVLGSQQGGGEHDAVEWHVVLGHEVVQLHLVAGAQHRGEGMTSYWIMVRSSSSKRTYLLLPTPQSTSFSVCSANI